MLLQEPAESPYDLRFNLFGFPIRVTWTFWILAVVFGFNLVDGLDQMAFVVGLPTPGRMPLLLLWTACIFLSILVHEFGHALAFRQFGISSSIVLYHFGGLAIPTSSYVPGRGFGRLTEQQYLWIAAAGPLAQIGSALLIVVAFNLSGFAVSIPIGERFQLEALPFGIDHIPGTAPSQMIESVGIFAMVMFYVWPSVVWALLNLVPVWPLDGGRITRSLILLFGGNTEQSLWISVVTAGALCAYGFTGGQVFIGILFLSLAVSSYQMLQGGMGPRF